MSQAEGFIAPCIKESKMTTVHQLKCVIPMSAFLEKCNFRVQFALVQVNILMAYLGNSNLQWRTAFLVV